jgi:hypothetical protein
MQNDPQLREVKIGTSVPAWIAEDLETLLYLLKRKGATVTKARFISAVLATFLNGDHVWAQELREFKAKINGSGAQ